jgi:hypothetical protein
MRWTSGWMGMNNKLVRIWKNVVGASLRYYSEVFLEGLDTTTKSCQDRWCPFRVSNRLPPEYKPTALLLHQLVVSRYHITKHQWFRRKRPWPISRQVGSLLQIDRGPVKSSETTASKKKIHIRNGILANQNHGLANIFIVYSVTRSMLRLYFLKKWSEMLITSCTTPKFKSLHNNNKDIKPEGHFSFPTPASRVEMSRATWNVSSNKAHSPCSARDYIASHQLRWSGQLQLNQVIWIPLL